METDTASSENKYVVGVCQLASNDAWNSATAGFVYALHEAFGAENVEVIVQVADGDADSCTQIANEFVSERVDLILGNATQALQSVSAVTTDIPVLGVSVVDYGIALGIENFDGIVGNNVSGTTDMVPMDQQAAMLQECFPDATEIGLVFCETELCSQYQINLIQDCLEEMGFTCVRYGFSEVSEIDATVQKAVEVSDVIYIPNEKAAMNATDVIYNICQPAGIPVVSGNQSICAECGVATLTINYYDLGVVTGQMAARVLRGEMSTSEMPIVSPTEYIPMYNAYICSNLNIEIPEHYIPME